MPNSPPIPAQGGEADRLALARLAGDVGATLDRLEHWTKPLDPAGGLTITLTIEQAEALAALRSPGAGDAEAMAAERMKERCLELVRYIRKNYRPVLNKSRYQAHEIQQFFGSACGLIDEDIQALPINDPHATGADAGDGA